jgi:prepilin-type N-terminal cleavage/methylation domain-containing protein
MFHHRNNAAFTLIELLTTVTVISVLMGILLPALNGARQTARALVCRSNMRATGLALLACVESSDGYFPPAYTYVGGNGLYSQPEEPVNGIYHWSGLLLGGEYIAEKAFHCPEIPDGGLAPQNTEAANLDRGQESGYEGVVDIQAERCAFTVNEVLCPRNRFRVGWEGAQRPSRLVASLRVRRPGRTILLTEWPTDWQVVSGADAKVSHSYLPVHGFRGLGEMAGQDRYDLNMTASDSELPCMSSGAFRRVNEYDLSNAPSGSRRYPPRLDWVGRNHRGTTAKKNLRRSTFFYLDGHMELKTVYETVEETNFEWGDKIYSLTGRNHIN